ncbi:MAG: AI-2E family transporter [Bacteroidales bacterium]
MKKLIPLFKIALFLLITIFLIYGLIQARQILYPLAFGGLIAYLLYPLVNYLEKNRFPRILAILVGIIFALMVLAGIFLLFYNQLGNMFDDFDALKDRAISNIENFQHTINEKLGLSDNLIERTLKKQVEFFFGAEGGGLREIFSTTTGTIFRLVILPVYVFLFLFYRTKFAYFILKVVNEEDKKVTIKILRDISTIASRYMGGVLIVVLILTVLNSSGLAIIGVEYALLLGIISAFFNFIPYFGTLMGGAIPLSFVLLTADQPAQMGIKVALFFVIIQFTENNILTPNIVGGNVKINPFFVIIGLVIGAVIWGIPGMLLIIPVLAIARIITSNIPHLKPYGFLLGPKGTQKHSIKMSRIKKIFHLKKKKDLDEETDPLDA